MVDAETRIRDARHRPLSEVDKLRQDARAAAEKRALQTHPDVVALRVERIRSQVDGLMWAGLLLGLAFTMVNVQTFAAGGAAAGSLPWVAAWLLDPMVSLVLIAVLRAEQVTARWQVDMRTAGTGPWVKRTKVFAFLATYTMNTWQSWSEGHVAGIVLHSVPPAMVYLAAETGPILRDRLTEAVLRAARTQDTGAATGAPLNATPDTIPDTAANGTGNAAGSAADVPAPVARPARSRKAPARKAGKPGRISREEYLGRARAAYRPGTVVTPAWVREVVPDISRGTSQVVSNLLNAELSTPRLAASPVEQTTNAGTNAGTDTTVETIAETAADAETGIEQGRAA